MHFSKAAKQFFPFPSSVNPAALLQFILYIYVKKVKMLMGGFCYSLFIFYILILYIFTRKKWKRWWEVFCYSLFIYFLFICLSIFCYSLFTTHFSVRVRDMILEVICLPYTVITKPLGLLLIKKKVFEVFFEKFSFHMGKISSAIYSLLVKIDMEYKTNSLLFTFSLFLL